MDKIKDVLSSLWDRVKSLFGDGEVKPAELPDQPPPPPPPHKP